MGNFSLTNPGLIYDQGQTVDPVTGTVVQMPPIVRYFKNPDLRAQQFTKDSAAAVAKAPLSVAPTTVTDASGGAIDAGGNPQMPRLSFAPGGGPQLGAASLPQPFKPSYAQTALDPSTGLPAPINPAQTKLGKLVTILAGAARGALAGWGTGNAAAGADRAREIPIQTAEQSAQLATTRAGLQPVNTPYGPMPAIYGSRIFPSLIGAQSRLAVQQSRGQTAETIAQENNQTKQAVAGINKRYIVAPGVGVFDTQQPDANGRPSLLSGTERGMQITPEFAQEKGLPAQMIGRFMTLDNLASWENAMSKYAPTVSSESSTTDLMGNTSTKRTTRKVPPGPGSGGMSALPAPGPGAVPIAVAPGAPAQPGSTQPGSTQAGTAAASPRLVRTASGPRPNGQTPKAPTAAPALTPLAPEVEQRLGASGLNPQEQQYIRGLLNYQGQMPSPRAKNYAATLATLTSIDPNFNAANYDANKKTFEDYSPGGSVGKQAIAFNTAIAHLDMLDQAASALQSKNYPLVNRIAQFFSVQTGQSPVTTFNNIADAVDGEVSKTFKGTATEGELARVGAHFNSALGPDQISNNIRSTIGLLNGKMGEMQSAFQRQVGKPINMVSPDAQRAIQRMTTNPNTVPVTDPRGVTHYFPNQQAADNFKRLAKIQ